MAVNKNETRNRLRMYTEHIQKYVYQKTANINLSTTTRGKK